MKCPVCKYDDEVEGTVAFFSIGDPIEGVVFGGGKFMDRSLKTNLYACPECGVVRIEAFKDVKKNVEKLPPPKVFKVDRNTRLPKDKFHEEDGRITSVTFGVDSDFKQPILTIGVDLYDDDEGSSVRSGFANTFVLIDAVKIIQATGVRDINFLVGKLCICDVENITGSPSCFFKRLKDG